MDRRRFLTVAVAGLTAGIGGCSENGTNESGTADDGETPGSSAGTVTETATNGAQGDATPAPAADSPGPTSGRAEQFVLDLSDLPGNGWRVSDSEGGETTGGSNWTVVFRRETERGTLETMTNVVAVRETTTQARDTYAEFGYEAEYAITPETTRSLTIGAESEWAKGQLDVNSYTNHVRVRDAGVAGYVAWDQTNNSEEFTPAGRDDIEPVAVTMHEKWR